MGLGGTRAGRGGRRLGAGASRGTRTSAGSRGAGARARWSTGRSRCIAEAAGSAWSARASSGSAVYAKGPSGRRNAETYLAAGASPPALLTTLNTALGPLPDALEVIHSPAACRPRRADGRLLCRHRRVRRRCTGPGRLGRVNRAKADRAVCVRRVRKGVRETGGERRVFSRRGRGGRPSVRARRGGTRARLLLLLLRRRRRARVLGRAVA